MLDDTLSGLRVLIVEDEMLVAILLEDHLSDHGSVVVGPAVTVSEALRILGSEPIDAAVMDVNIGGEKAYPVADALDRRGIPFLIVSGFGASAIPPDRPNWRVCAKPFTGDGLVAMLKAQILAVRA